jgi:hypothetical protein
LPSITPKPPFRLRPTPAILAYSRGGRSWLDRRFAIAATLDIIDDLGQVTATNAIGDSGESVLVVCGRYAFTEFDVPPGMVS